MNTHTAAAAGETTAYRTYQEGTVIPILPGCYVDGSVRTVRSATIEALSVAYGVGALSPREYGALVAAFYTIEPGDSQAWIEEGEGVVDILNAANVDPLHAWMWEASDLCYLPVEDEPFAYAEVDQ